MSEMNRHAKIYEFKDAPPELQALAKTPDEDGWALEDPLLIMTMPLDQFNDVDALGFFWLTADRICDNRVEYKTDTLRVWVIGYE